MSLLKQYAFQSEPLDLGPDPQRIAPALEPQVSSPILISESNEAVQLSLLQHKLEALELRLLEQQREHADETRRQVELAHAQGLKEGLQEASIQQRASQEQLAEQVRSLCEALEKGQEFIEGAALKLAQQCVARMVLDQDRRALLVRAHVRFLVQRLDMKRFLQLELAAKDLSTEETLELARSLNLSPEAIRLDPALPSGSLRFVFDHQEILSQIDQQMLQLVDALRALQA